MAKRFVLLVVDGLGVGQMPDVALNRPQDAGSNTFAHVIAHNGSHTFTNFRAINALDYFISHTFKTSSFLGWNCSFGKNMLAHYGADSFMGHQEIAGSKPKKPTQQFLEDKKRAICHILKKNNYKIKLHDGVIHVDKMIFVSDNIESDVGYNMNVVGSLFHHDFSTIKRVGLLVRSVVQVGRVITMGGKKFTLPDVVKAMEHKKLGTHLITGINIPKLNIYDDNYQVIHIGYGINSKKQAPSLIAKTHPVVLIGKAADVIVANNAKYYPAVHTEDVVQLLLHHILLTRDGMIFANIQETDLAGHSQDIAAYTRHLLQADKAIPAILKILGKDDVFIVTGDHGNDPTIGHSLHTREMTPLIVFSKSSPSTNFNIRVTLADIGASACSFFNLSPPDAGKSFL